MFGFLFNRRRETRPARTPVARTTAAWETLESRQLLSATPFASTGLLSLSATKSTLPPAVLAGAKVKGSVTLSLTNRLTVNDTGVNTFTVYASLDGVIDATDPQLGQLQRPVNLKPARSLKVTVPVKNFPAPNTDGTYQILIQAINATGDVSNVVSPLVPSTLVVAPANVALTATVGAANPTALSVGRTTAFKVVLINSGNVDATGVLTANIGFSQPGAGVLTLQLTTKTSRPRIRAGGRGVSFTYRVKIPATIAPGTYDLGVAFSELSATAPVAFSPTQITIG